MCRHQILEALARNFHAFSSFTKSTKLNSMQMLLFRRDLNSDIGLSPTLKSVCVCVCFATRAEKIISNFDWCIRLETDRAQLNSNLAASRRTCSHTQMVEHFLNVLLEVSSFIAILRQVWPSCVMAPGLADVKPVKRFHSPVQVE